MSINSVVDLEMKIAYMEKTISELNSVIISQGDMLDVLKSQVKGLNLKFEKYISENIKDINDEEPPPHY